MIARNKKKNSMYKLQKVVIFGEDHTGKNAFVRYHLTGLSCDKLTIRVKNRNFLVFDTTEGSVGLDVHIDTPQEVNKLNAYIHTSAAIFFLSPNIPNNTILYKEFRKVSPVCPVVACISSKYSELDDDILEQMLQFAHDHHLAVIIVSSQTGYNIDEPFLYLLRSIFQKHQLELINLPHSLGSYLKPKL
jgi:hypothetical protein